MTAEQIKPMADRHREYQDLYTEALQLYKEITEKGLEKKKAS